MCSCTSVPSNALASINTPAPEIDGGESVFGYQRRRGKTLQLSIVLQTHNGVEIELSQFIQLGAQTGVFMHYTPDIDILHSHGLANDGWCN